jgi:16S rRNA processing protein RimM
MEHEHAPRPDETLLIGMVVGPFGIRGQLKVRALTDDLEHLQRRIRTVYVGPKLRPHRLKSVAEHKPGLLIVVLEGVTTRDEAEELRGADLAILATQAAPLADDEYFLHDLPGMSVEAEDGTPIGVVRDYLQTGANEVLVVKRDNAPDALIPIVRDIVIVLDVAARRIVIRPIPGLLDT